MPSIGASGILGVALETTSGTYVAPTKFIPFNKESLKYDPNMQERTPIRNTPGLVDLVPGNGSVSGDIEFDVSADLLLFFMYASRCSVVKTGSAPYVYTFTPSPMAVPAKTMSVSVKRGNEVFGYTGCVVSSFKLSVDDKGILNASFSLVGNNEATQTALTATWPTTPVISAGMYKLEIPTTTQVYDTDKWEFSAEDNAQANARIKNTTGAQFVNFGESRATMTVERDFENRAQYDLFKIGTAQSVTMTGTQSANNIVSVTMPVAKQSGYDINIEGVGDLLRAKVEFTGVIDATGKHYQMVVTTAENIT